MSERNPILSGISFKRATMEEKHDAYLAIREDPEFQQWLMGQHYEKEKTTQLVTIAETLESAKKHIATAGQMIGLSTGYKALDDVICGLRQGELDVVFGDTGHMKSTLVQNITLNIALTGSPVLFIGTEMVNDENTARFIEMLGDADRTAALPILYPEQVPDYKEVAELVEAAVGEGARLVVIDHLHMFQGDGENEQAGITKIMLEFKRVALKYEVPILLVSHVSNDRNRKGIPELADLKGSSSIKQLATHAIAVWIDRNIDDEAQKLIVKSRKNRRAVKRLRAEFHILANARLADQIMITPGSRTV